MSTNGNPTPAPTPEELFAEQREKRIAKRIEIETALAGDPVARAGLQRNWDPILDAHSDWQAADPDDLDSKIVVNQDLNL